MSARDDVWFTSGGDRCVGWWYRPENPNGTAIVMANGFSLTRHDGLPPFAERLAAAGCYVLAFDHRYLGDSGGEPRQRFRIGHQQEDWRNAIAHVRGLDEGIEKVVVWGYSFAGAHASRMAAEREDVDGALLLFPFADGLARMLATSPSLAAWATPRAVLDLAGRHTLIPVTGEPDERAAMNFPGEARGFQATVEAGSPWRNEISPGVLAVIATYRPKRWAKRMRCPVWVGLGERDITVAGAAIEKLALLAPDSELHRYPYSHFGPFEPEATALIATDQLDFLDRRGLM
jgi:pimeloyl-ACP methyl ester carboxylesterase